MVFMFMQDVVAYHSMPLPGYQITALNSVAAETGSRDFVIEILHVKQSGTLPPQKNLQTEQKSTFYLQAENADQMNR
jgi:hypothetical protein